MAKAKAKPLVPAVQYLVDQYREQFGDATFDEERHVKAFGDTIPWEENASTVATMSDDLVIQVILMDLFARSVKYENEIERLLGVIDESAKAIGNRATRRKK